jgi:RNA polymerase sigma factor (sigma-70 family)
VAASETHRAVEAVWRIESARLIAGLARRLGDVGLAEDLAQEALLAALERWPESGIPDNPGAWLMATAKNRGIDRLRHRQRATPIHEQLGRELDRDNQAAADRLVDEIDDEIGDDLLRLLFIACHPVLPPEGRVALTLRLLGGLTTREIARAFLVPEATLAQRIVRAKRTLAEAGVPFELPPAAERRERLASVFAVIYLVFNEGYAASGGEDWVRHDLCAEALRLARVLTGLVPDEPEAWGLTALLELQASRLAARSGPDGEAVLLDDQDRSRWDRLLIRRGLAALERARRTADATRSLPGPYTVQAEIAACHARARTAAETDWPRIVALYEMLSRIAPSPVIDLNRAVAVSRAAGPAAGLAIVDGLLEAPALAGYHLLPAVRGDLLARLGRASEARAEFERAARMTDNARERQLLLARAAGCIA